MFAPSIRLSVDSAGGGAAPESRRPDQVLKGEFDRLCKFVQNPGLREIEFYRRFNPRPGEIVHNFIVHLAKVGDGTGVLNNLRRLVDADTNRLPAELSTVIDEYQNEASNKSPYFVVLSSSLQREQKLQILEALFNCAYPLPGENKEQKLFEYAIHNGHRYAVQRILKFYKDNDLSTGEHATKRLNVIEHRLSDLTRQIMGRNTTQGELDEAEFLFSLAAETIRKENPDLISNASEGAHRNISSIVILSYARLLLRQALLRTELKEAVLNFYFKGEEMAVERAQFVELLDVMDLCQASGVKNFYPAFSDMVDQRMSLSAMISVARTLKMIGRGEEGDSGAPIAHHLNALLSNMGRKAFRTIALNLAIHGGYTENGTNVAEILPLFAQTNRSGDEQAIDEVTMALTAPFRLFSKGLSRLDWRTSNFLAELGAFTHMHRVLRADAERFEIERQGKKELTSLLELSGFTLIATNKVFNRFIGLVFRRVIRTSNGPVTVDISRAGMAVSSPKLGYLFIRNSSPSFTAREKYKYPAYFIRDYPISDAQSFWKPKTKHTILKEIDPNKHVLSPDFLKDPEAIDNAITLSSVLRSVLVAHAKFKLNTDHREIATAQADGLFAPLLNAPYANEFSPGLPYILIKAREKLLKGKKPKLAWVDGYPEQREGVNQQNIATAPVSFHPFVGSNGDLQYSLSLTHEGIILLWDRIRGESSTAFRQQFHSFFRLGVESGLNLQLMLIDWE